MSYEWTAMSYQEKLVGNSTYFIFALAILLVYFVLAGQYESLDHARRGDSRRAAGVARNGRRIARSRRGEQSLCADRPRAPHRALGQERHPDRRDGSRRTRRGQEHRGRDRRGRADALSADPDDFFTFILGVLPLVLASGAGASARKSLGLAVATGMLASTCLAVLFVPAFYVVLQRWVERRRSSRS